MAKIRFQIAPDVEFKMDLDVEGITADSRDYDIQQQRQRSTGNSRNA